MMKLRVAVAFIFFILLGGALYLSFSYPKEAKALPLLVLIPGVPLAFWNLLSEMKWNQNVLDQEEKSSTKEEQKRRTYQIFLSLMTLFLLSWLFGITIGFPLFIFIYLRWISRESLGTTIFSTLLSWIFLYFGFEVLMRSNFEKGVLLNLILS